VIDIVRGWFFDCTAGRGFGPPNVAYRTPAIGTAMASVSMNFGPQNCGAVPRTSVEDQGAARMIEDYVFPMGSNF
jgi:hypothetical protein